MIIISAAAYQVSSIVVLTTVFLFDDRSLREIRKLVFGYAIDDHVYYSL